MVEEHMIAVPFKDCKPVNWSGYLKSYLSKLYGSSDNFSDAIEDFNKARDAIQVAPRHAQGQDFLYRYYGQLELLAMRIPVEGTNKIEFEWKNVFDDEWVTQNALAFEKACLLFNLGATFSSAGASGDSKVAYSSFKAAAGIFSFISEKFIHTPTTDLAPDTMRALSTLMLAQAQEAFWDKASTNSATKPGLKAKLAQAAADLYEAADAQLKSIYDESNWGDRDWLEIIKTKGKNLQARANYYHAISLEDSKKHGLAIAHMKEAKKLGEPEAGNIIKRWEKDNDLLWHEAIPATVEAVPAAQMAKPTAMDALYPSGEDASKVVGRDLFVKVIPLAVHEKASLYSEMQADLVRNENQKAEIADQEMKSALEYMDLPQAADLLRDPERFEAELLQVPEIAQGWNVTELNLNFDQQRQRILALASSNPHSHQVKQSLVNAGATDKSLADMLEPVKSDVAILAKGSGSGTPLYKLFTDKSLSPEDPAAQISLLDLDTSAGDTFTEDLAAVSDLTAQLRKIEIERRNILRELRDRVHGDDISAVLLTNQKSSNLEESVFKPELAKFKPIIKKIDATVRLQKSLLSELATKWRTILSTPQAKQSAAKRNELLSRRNELVDRFQHAFEVWTTVSEGLQKAKSFYNQLEKMAMMPVNDTTESLPSIGTSIGTGPPPIPPKPSAPQLPPKPQSPVPGQSGYTVPSAYDPSFYN